MVIKRERKYTSSIGLKNVEEIIIIPLCYANYCKNHISCKNCVVRNKCKEIPKPKEPQWCNPD